MLKRIKNVFWSSPCLQSAGYMTSQEDSASPVFTPSKLPDHLFDITLLVKGERQFKAHRHVLEDASPYFEKLLNCDMKEAREGVIRLEKFTEVAVGGLLEFIYTGKVQISTQEIAIDLFMMADYLLLPSLKSLAERFLLGSTALKVSNCISTYHLAEKHNLKALVWKTESFILANFVSVAKTEAFLNLSKECIEMWISGDDINVCAEKEVFEVILAWIKYDKSEREIYFSELFRQVRLVYVSLDCLRSDIVTNDFVKHNQSCLNLVKQAIKLTQSQNYKSLSIRPRKSLEMPFLVVCTEVSILFYCPRQDKWFVLDSSLPIASLRDSELASCGGKLCFFNPRKWADWEIKTNVFLYGSLSRDWNTMPYMSKPEEHRSSYLKQIFVRDEKDIFALLTEACLQCDNLGCICSRRSNLMSFLTKYTPETNSWKDVASFDLGSREGICIAAKSNFVYFIGGGVRVPQNMDTSLRKAERYDLTTNQWVTVASLQEGRMFACGAAYNEKIFVASGVNKENSAMLQTCEVYSEATNEWQFIANMVSKPGYMSCMLCADDKLYVLGGLHLSYLEARKLQCYDPEKNEWSANVKIPFRRRWSNLARRYECYLNACSLRVFNGFVGKRHHNGLRSKLNCFTK